MIGLDSFLRGPSVLDLAKEKSAMETTPSRFGDVIEIWDVRRGWIAKWSVCGSGAECGVSGMFIEHFLSLMRSSMTKILLSAVHMLFGPSIPAVPSLSLIYMKLANRWMPFRVLRLVGKQRVLCHSLLIKWTLWKFRMTMREAF